MRLSAPSLVVLGSQSPRRHALLSLLVGAGRVRIVPPQQNAEAGFDDATTLEAIDERLQLIARGKFHDVAAQLDRSSAPAALVTADTTIVGFDAQDHPVVLGKPPDDPAALRKALHHWFADFYAGRQHLAKTAVCVGLPDATPLHTVVTTAVWFRADSGQFVDWYIGTGEPRGKAGGYAIQEAGSLFVERLEGSLSNVVGLPLVETRALLARVGAI